MFTSRTGSLTNDFFVNLRDMGTTWTPTPEDSETFVRDFAAAFAEVMDLDRYDVA